MKSRLTQTLAALLLLVAAPAANTQSSPGSAAPPFQFYSAADGLTRSDVLDIEQDRTGYLWLATKRGLNRFDGERFFHITTANGLPVNHIEVLHIGADETVWVGDAGGNVSAVRGQRVVTAAAPEAGLDEGIVDIESIGERVFVVAGKRGLFEVAGHGDDLRLLPVAEPDIEISDLVVAGRRAWVTAPDGLYRLQTEPEFELEKVSDDVTHLHAAQSGELWAADRGNNVGIWRRGAFEIRATLDMEDPISGLATESDGTLWASAVSGLFRISPASMSDDDRAYAIKRYDDVSTISTLFIDRDDSLWLSASSRLVHFLGDRFRHYHLRTDADSEVVWAISEDPAGRYWFGTTTKLIIRNVDESVVVLGPEHGIEQGPVRDIVFDGNDSMWVGVRRKGLFRVAVDTLRGQLVDGTAGLRIVDIVMDGTDALWFSTQRTGVYRYSLTDGSLTNFESPSGGKINTLDVSADGSVWFGADRSGLFRLKPAGDGGYERQAFDSGVGLEQETIFQVRVAGDDHAWIVTQLGRLYEYRSGVFTRYDERSRFSDQSLYLVEPLDDGTLLVGGDQGLYQFVPGSKPVAHYNRLRGFVGVEANLHATFFDADGHLWIGTVDGATRMDVSMPMQFVRDPSPQILTMVSGRDRLPLTDNADVDPHQLGVHFEFAAVALLHPGRLEYSYRLHGMENDWGPATFNQTVYYSGLSPGNYEFAVRARFLGGEWSGEIARRSFTVLPYIWQRPWFVVAAGLAVIALLSAAMTFRTRRIQRMNDALRTEVENRTQSIERARQRLEVSNDNLSREIRRRQEADDARAEIETRFRRAFDKVPIGIGLLDRNGKLFDANPALVRMFLSGPRRSASIHFPDVVEGADRERFRQRYDELVAGATDFFDDSLRCLGSGDQRLDTLVSLSAVRKKSGKLLYVVLQIQDVTESLRLTDQLEYQASYDDLTGLLNRRSFEKLLQQALQKRDEDQHCSYLMYMDLDQFKVVNDTSGHAAGDQLLRRVSEILQETVRADDSVCRLGGDEFGVILWKCPPTVAARVAEQLRAAIEDLRFQWDAETYRIGVSIGGVPIDPEIGDVSELQQLADSACYAAKDAGRNCVHMVSGGEDTAIRHRGQVRWAQRLRDAIDNNRFTIYGQNIRPLDDSADEPERFEILLRLRDPKTRRFILPGTFMPAAERYGLIIDMDEWVVRSALDTLYVHQSFQAKYAKYWINLSGTSIGDPRFAEFLIDAVRRSPLPPGTINFEVTETSVIRNIGQAGKLMTELREMQCQFALDDFGAGLSSFGYLKNLPIDYLKIDGMFIRNILTNEIDRIFVKSIIDIAHALDIKAVAGFVENDETLQMVRDLGADYAQGFATGEPFAITPDFCRRQPFVDNAG